MSQIAPSKTTRYVVISPARDEEQYIEKTIESMLQQTIRPAQWILVNDGSSDRTAEIIEHWAAKEPWIVAVHRTTISANDVPNSAEADAVAPSGSKANRGRRARQAKEIEAFYEGYERITVTDWEFLVKLDSDVGFESDYFERCLAEFHADSKLGVGGGVICHWQEGELQIETTPSFHVRGATKTYRRLCWDQIGGVLRGAGWDTIDEVKANMLGWSSRSFTQLKVVHYRFTGAANGAWQNAIKNGVWNYISGYHPLFMLLKCIKRLFEKPHLTSVGLFYGFLLGYIQRIPQIDDKDLIRYLREQQLRKLAFRTTIWK
jgi:biofilm PGA synthesis N-glycosyltransferase PgaC